MNILDFFLPVAGEEQFVLQQLQRTIRVLHPAAKAAMRRRVLEVFISQLPPLSARPLSAPSVHQPNPPIEPER